MRPEIIIDSFLSSPEFDEFDYPVSYTISYSFLTRRSSRDETGCRTAYFWIVQTAVGYGFVRGESLHLFALRSRTMDGVSVLPACVIHTSTALGGRAVHQPGGIPDDLSNILQGGEVHPCLAGHPPSNNGLRLIILRLNEKVTLVCRLGTTRNETLMSIPMFLYRTAIGTACKIIEARIPYANERQGSIDKTPKLRAAEDRLERQTLTRALSICRKRTWGSKSGYIAFPQGYGIRATKLALRQTATRYSIRAGAFHIFSFRDCLIPSRFPSYCLSTHVSSVALPQPPLQRLIGGDIFVVSRMDLLLSEDDCCFESCQVEYSRGAQLSSPSMHTAANFDDSRFSRFISYVYINQSYVSQHQQACLAKW